MFWPISGGGRRARADIDAGDGVTALAGGGLDEEHYRRRMGGYARSIAHYGGAIVALAPRSERWPAEMPDNLQLAVYHLAAARDPELAACGPATELDLVFLRSMKVRSQPVTDDHEAATEARARVRVWSASCARAPGPSRSSC